MTFVDELEPILTDLVNPRSHVLLAGDFNIDLLSIKNRNVYNDYFENMLSWGLFPRITLPTRISTTCTLLDNIFTNFSCANDLSRIIVSDISDHLPCLFAFKTDSFKTMPIIKYCYQRDMNDTNLRLLCNKLDSLSIMNELDRHPNGNPNLNYIKLENVIYKSMNETMPQKKVKYNKYKHKKSKWITYGIIRSIKFRDNLYRRVKATSLNTDDYANKKNNLKVYNEILKNLICKAKEQFYRNQFAKYKNDIKKPG